MGYYDRLLTFFMHLPNSVYHALLPQTTLSNEFQCKAMYPTDTNIIYKALFLNRQKKALRHCIFLAD